MTNETEATESRLRGPAAWKAARDATEQRNADAKRRAHEHVVTHRAAAAERTRSRDLAERVELLALNEQIGARQELRDGGQAAGGPDS